MGRKKNKWTKKEINFYRFVFKFDIPFKVLVDGNFVGLSIKKKFDLKEKLKKFLDDEVHLVITSCVYNEIKEYESKIPGMLNAIARYPIEECKHGLTDPTNCIRDYIGKKNMGKYFVATQDQFLRAQLRKVPGVPLIFFDQNILLIEKLSVASKEACERRECLKEDPQKSEKKVLSDNKKEIRQFLIDEYKNSKYYKDKQEQYKISKLMGEVRKKAKGPNALSVKKKQSFYEQKEKNIKYQEELKKHEEEGTLEEFIKKKRKRSKKKKNTQVVID